MLFSTFFVPLSSIISPINRVWHSVLPMPCPTSSCCMWAFFSDFLMALEKRYRCELIIGRKWKYWKTWLWRRCGEEWRAVVPSFRLDDVSMMGFFSLVTTTYLKNRENVPRSDAFINFPIVCLESVRKDVMPNFFLIFCNNQIIGGRPKGCQTPILGGKETYHLERTCWVVINFSLKRCSRN